MILPAGFLERVGACSYLGDDPELQAAAAADLRVLAGLPGHRTPAGAWLDVVPFLPAYQGAVAAVLAHRASPSDGDRAGLGVRTDELRGTVARLRPGADGAVSTVDLLASQGVPVVSLDRLLAETGGAR